MASQKVSQTIKTTVIGTESSTYEIIKEYTEDKSSSGEEACLAIKAPFQVSERCRTCAGCR